MQPAQPHVKNGRNKAAFRVFTQDNASAGDSASEAQTAEASDASSVASERCWLPYRDVLSVNGQVRSFINPRTGGPGDPAVPSTWGTCEEAFAACEKYGCSGLQRMGSAPRRNAGDDNDEAAEQPTQDEAGEGTAAYSAQQAGRIQRITRPGLPNRGVSFLSDDTGMHELTLRNDGKLDFVSRADGKFTHSPNASQFETLGWLEVFAQSGAVALPAGVDEYGNIDKLADKIRAHIHRYFDCPPQFESVAVLFVLLTWIPEPFHAVPYLRFLGVAGTGKSRGSDVIGSICYRRLAIAGAMTPAVMYRTIEAVGGTLAIDEADFANSSIGTEIAKILNCGYQRGSPVLRMEKINEAFEPRAYQVFGPKILNGRGRFSDDATESRCLTLVTRETARMDIPTQLPPEFHREALALRNRLLRFRYDYYQALEFRNINIAGIGRRINQIILPLLLIAEELKDSRYKDDLLAYARDLDAQTQQDRRETLDAALVAAYVALSDANKPVTCGDVHSHMMEEMGCADLEMKFLCPRKVSTLAKTLGFTSRHTMYGSVLSIDQSKLKSLCERFSIVSQSSCGSSSQAPDSAQGHDDNDDDMTMPVAA